MEEQRLEVRLDVERKMNRTVRDVKQTIQLTILDFNIKLWKQYYNQWEDLKKNNNFKWKKNKLGRKERTKETRKKEERNNIRIVN